MLPADGHTVREPFYRTSRKNPVQKRPRATPTPTHTKNRRQSIVGQAQGSRESRPSKRRGRARARRSDPSSSWAPAHRSNFADAAEGTTVLGCFSLVHFGPVLWSQRPGPAQNRQNDKDAGEHEDHSDSLHQRPTPRSLRRLSTRMTRSSSVASSDSCSSLGSSSE